MSFSKFMMALLSMMVMSQSAWSDSYVLGKMFGGEEAKILYRGLYNAGFQPDQKGTIRVARLICDRSETQAGCDFELNQGSIVKPLAPEKADRLHAILMRLGDDFSVFRFSSQFDLSKIECKNTSTVSSVLRANCQLNKLTGF